MGRPSKASLREARLLPASTFVLDNGAYHMKAGFAPSQIKSDIETLSKCYTIPNALARTRDKKTYLGAQLDKDVTQWSDAIFRRPIEKGQLVSWETEKEIWDHSFFDERTAIRDLLIDHPETTTLILAETPNTMPALQKNADEIVMEEWGFGGYYRVVGPSLNAYNDLHGLFGDTVPASSSNSPMECVLVVDSGFSGTVITPVYNGRPIQRAIRRIDLGGKHLTSLLKEIVSVRYFDLHQDTKVVNDIKEDICFVSQDFKSDMEKTWKGNRKNAKSQPATRQGQDADEMDIDDSAMKPEDSPLIDYILPDGIHRLRGSFRPHDPSTAISKKRKMASSAGLIGDSDDVSMTLGSERFTVPEILFSPSDVGSRQPGIPDTVMQSLSVLPPLIQATMLANVLVVGGNANIPGFVDRLQTELRERVKTEWMVRVRKIDVADPAKSTWLGGARMATDRDLVRKWGVSRDEYFEHGSAWVARRFLTGVVE